MKRCQHKCKQNEQKYKFSINLKKTTKGNVLYTLLCGVITMNFKKETGFRYKIKNQNGLNNALYDYYDPENNGRTKTEIRKALQNYPNKYPCKITIIDQMFECCRIYVDIEYYNWFFTKLNRWFF